MTPMDDDMEEGTSNNGKLREGQNREIHEGNLELVVKVEIWQLHNSRWQKLIFDKTKTQYFDFTEKDQLARSTLLSFVYLNQEI